MDRGVELADTTGSGEAGGVSAVRALRTAPPQADAATVLALRTLADRIERGEVAVSLCHDSRKYRDAPQHRELKVSYTEVQEGT